MKVRFAVLILLAIASPFQLASGAAAETLVLGTVNSNVKKHFARFSALADLLAVELEAAGVDDVDIAVLPSAASMAAAMRDGEVDLYFDSAVAVAVAAREADARPFLRRWKKGVASYHSVIVVPTDSLIYGVDDLRGHTIAFQDPDSTSGFMLPASLLFDHGLALRELASRDDPVGPDELGYVFTRNDDNSVVWLYRGLIDAIATDPRHAAKLESASPGSIRIIARSIDVPRQVVAHRPDLDPSLCRAVADVLVAMESTDAGREALDAFAETTRFDAFPESVALTFEPIFGVLDTLAAHGLR